MTVDSFKYLPRIIAAFYQTTERQPEFPIPWTPLSRPLSECKFGLVTSGGLYHKDIDPPFDLEREKQEPTWGDPTYRSIPFDIQQAEVGASHLHINTQDVLADINILLPIQRFQELDARGVTGSLANKAYSFMGYQGFPPDATAWQETYGPQVAQKLKAEEVDCVLLTPAGPDCAINVPVLARSLEAAGLSTVLVTNMPYWAEKTGVPRSLAVEFPFGHLLGQPHETDQQRRVIRQALEVLECAEEPGSIIHSPEVWPVTQKEAQKNWQPEIQSPVVQYLGPRFREIMREQRRKNKKL